ncbi:MAG: hypothetical protein J5I98_04360 [Phaeodactylibacter sp.]|nr:hypothetical protein [Phaeodactylibacter sp.]
MDHRLPFRLVQAAAVSVFLGRAWQHLYWDAPYRALLWDEAWMKPLVEPVLGIGWREYVTSSQTDIFIQSLIAGTGWFYLACALAALFVGRLGRVGRAVLWVGAANLVLLAALYCKEKFFFAGQFFEYTLQWGAPVMLAVLAKNPDQPWPGRFVLFVKIAIALTFTCHGLYAVGFYPRPGSFLVMTLNILPVNETGAVHFLNTAGALDFLLSLALFLPGRWPRAALAYAAFWGLATSVARVWAHFHWEFWDNVLIQWLHESVMRFPHFLVPLALLLVLSRTQWMRNGRFFNILEG